MLPSPMPLKKLFRFYNVLRKNVKCATQLMQSLIDFKSIKTLKRREQKLSTGVASQSLRHVSHVQSGIRLPWWPTDSPDLNPIENLWSHIRCELSKHDPRNVREIKRLSETFLVSEDAKTFARDVHLSFKCKLEKCIALEGRKVPY